MEEKIKKRVALMEECIKKYPPSEEEQEFEWGRFPHNDFLDNCYVPLCVLTVSLDNLTPFSVLGLGWVYQWLEERGWDVHPDVKTFIEESSLDKEIPELIRELLKSMLKKIDECKEQS